MARKSITPLTDKVFTRAPYWQNVPDEKLDGLALANEQPSEQPG